MNNRPILSSARFRVFLLSFIKSPGVLCYGGVCFPANRACAGYVAAGKYAKVDRNYKVLFS
jgi:hypothetical protein